MKKILIWDFPLRCLHWAFAGSLLAALGCAFLCDEQSSRSSWQRLCGIAAAAWIGGRFAPHAAATSSLRLPFTGTSTSSGESEGGPKARVKERRMHRDDHE